MHGYTKIREVGSGSFGKAILVKDAEGKQYIMKTIDISRMNKKERAEAINEVKVLSSLKHPYIVSYRESFVDNGQLCIVMDYADGGDLHKRIQKQKKMGQSLTEQQVLRWFTQATLALKYIHDKHILHRDLKTQNFFLTGSGRLRIGDFGISKVLESTAAFAQTTIGTPYYLSPEICKEQPYSWSSDIWALGCVLFELCALRVPFDAPNIRSLVDRITRGPTPSIPGHYSSGLRELVSDILQRDWSKRPSAADILQRDSVQGEIRRMLKEEQSKRPAPSVPSADGKQNSDAAAQDRAPASRGPSSRHATPSRDARSKDEPPTGARARPNLPPAPKSAAAYRSPSSGPVSSRPQSRNPTPERGVGPSAGAAHYTPRQPVSHRDPSPGAPRGAAFRAASADRNLAAGRRQFPPIKP